MRNFLLFKIEYLQSVSYYVQLVNVICINRTKNNMRKDGILYYCLKNRTLKNVKLKTQNYFEWSYSYVLVVFS